MMLEFMRLISLWLTLILLRFPLSAQNAPSTQGPTTPATVVASPLDGNWLITGNRQRKQYPALSMLIHVNGSQIVAAGSSMTVCSNSAAMFGGNFDLYGEIETDGTFTLHPPPLPFAVQLTIVGKVPPAGSTNWNGTYTLSQKPGAQGSACAFERKGSFNASLLPSLPTGFSGQLELGYPWPPPQGSSPEYLNKTSRQLKVNIAVEQSGLVFNEADTYLPLSGTIQIEGCPCFSHGMAVGDHDNRMKGESVRMKFKMDDDSELFVFAYYRSHETGLSFMSHVRDGKCAGLGFDGTLFASTN